MAQGTVRIVYEDPSNTGKPFVFEYDGRYWVFDPPKGHYELVTGDYGCKVPICVDSEAKGRSFWDVPTDMLRAAIYTGDTIKRYQAMGGKGNPFKELKVVLENQDRQIQHFRDEAEKARREAEEFKMKLQHERNQDKTAYERTIAALQEEVRKAKSPAISGGEAKKDK